LFHLHNLLATSGSRITAQRFGIFNPNGRSGGKGGNIGTCKLGRGQQDRLRIVGPNLRQMAFASTFRANQQHLMVGPSAPRINSRKGQCAGGRDAEIISGQAGISGQIKDQLLDQG
jgi:hypothetical protein